jgi:hypothetical protein
MARRQNLKPKKEIQVMKKSIIFVVLIVAMASLSCSLFSTPVTPDPIPVSPTDVPATTIPSTLPPTVIPTSTQNTDSSILYKHDFSFDDNNWGLESTTGDFTNIESNIQNGKYRITVTANQENVYGRRCLQNHSFDNFILSVDITLVDGPDPSSYSLTFRKSSNDVDNGGNYYELRLNNLGEYKMNLRKDGEFTTLIDWNTSDALIRDGTNHIKIKADNSKFTIYANDKDLALVADDTLRQGEICFHVAISDVGARKIVDYDNILITSVTP